LFYPLCILNVLNASALVISQLYGFGRFYYIDTENIYHRGPFFLIPAFITIMLMLVAFVIIVKNRRSLGNKSFFSLIFFAIPPFIGIILQIAFYGISFMLNSVVLSLLVVFLNIQNYSIHTDHLTGLNNRRKLDAYLKEKISLCTSDKVFSIILLDINDFKCINDTYGHNIGDSALETAAKLLKSCLRARDFIARYGGDEFCIILDISDISDLEAVVYRINDCLEKHNKCNSNSYKLEFSMGYAVYDYASHKNAEDFIKQVDILMYENKLANKNKTDISSI